MSGIASDRLFSLIKSLSSGEKRYFKTMVPNDSNGSNPIYVQLFDAIDSQTEYDEKAILRKRKSINPAQLSNIKKYLFDFILKSLRNYHAEKSVDMILRDYLDNIEILYDKRLTEECYKLIDKAKEIAEKYEKNSYAIDLLNWEEKVAGIGPSANKVMLSSIQRFEVISDNIGKLKTTNEYAKIFRAVVDIFRKGGMLKDKKVDAELKKIMDSPILQNDKKLISFFDYYYYYSIKSIYNLLLSNWEEHYKHQKKVLNFIEARPYQMKDSLNIYLASLNTFLICCQFTKQYSELTETFNKISVIALKHKKNMPTNTFIQVLGCYNSMIHHCIQVGDFDKGVFLFKEIEHKFNPEELKLNKSAEMSIFYAVAYTYFGVQNYKTALLWLNKILNTPYPEGVRDDIQSFARIFNLILHFEMGNQNLLEYIVKSTYRFLYKRKRLYQLESLVLNFIRKNSWVNGKEDLVLAFKELYKDLHLIMNNPYEKKALSYFNLLAWLESKTQGITFAEAVKRSHTSQA